LCSVIHFTSVRFVRGKIMKANMICIYTFVVLKDVCPLLCYTYSSMTLFTDILAASWHWWAWRGDSRQDNDGDSCCSVHKGDPN
jgi:hypothetical protein